MCVMDFVHLIWNKMCTVDIMYVCTDVFIALLAFSDTPHSCSLPLTHVMHCMEIETTHIQAADIYDLQTDRYTMYILTNIHTHTHIDSKRDE